MLELWPFSVLWRENNINTQYIISTTQMIFSRQRTIIIKLLTCGVTREGMRGIPPRVTLEELRSKKANIETKGTSKEAVTEGNPKRTNCIEAIMYDTTPVHCISMVSE